MRKKLLIDVLIGCLGFLLVVFLGQNDKKVYQNQLNRNGLSENAVVFDSNSSQSLKATVSQLSQLSWENYQVQFQLNTNTSYLYQKGTVASLPLVQGSFFADADFSSKVPVVVVGQDLNKKLYTPTKQSYYIWKNHYLSVLGQVGVNGKSALNQHIFISTSPEFVFADPTLRGVKIVVDGDAIDPHLHQLASIFHSDSQHKLVTHNSAIVGTNWLETYGWLVFEMVLILLALIALTFIFWQFDFKSKKAITTNTDTQSRSDQRYFRLFTAQALSFFIAGVLAGVWRLYLINISRVFIIAGLLALIVGSFYVFLTHRQRSAVS